MTTLGLAGGTSSRPPRGFGPWPGFTPGGGRSQPFYREKVYLSLGFASLEDYLVGGWEERFLQLDANDLLAMLNTCKTAT